MKKSSAILALALSFFLSAASVHAQALGQPCLDFACDGDLVCKGNICQPPPSNLPGTGTGGQGTGCFTQADCTSGYVCDTSSDTCIPASQSVNTGNGETGSACETNADCFSGVCDTSTFTCASTAGSSGQGCSSGGASCPTGETCQFGTCISTSGTPSGSTPGAGGINTSYIQGYETSIVGIINNILVPLLIAVAFIVFLYGAFKYFILGGAEPESRKEGAQYILYAVIGFVLIFSVWGLVNLLMGTLSLTTGSLAPPAPTL